MLILLQSFSKVWIVFSFKINQDYIARVLCINRDKPETLCSGKCVLTQRIQADEEQEKKGVPHKQTGQKETLYCFEYFAGLSERPVLRAEKQKNTFQHQTPITAAMLKGIFHPPNFVRV